MNYLITVVMQTGTQNLQLLNEDVQSLLYKRGVSRSYSFHQASQIEYSFVKKY